MKKKSILKLALPVKYLEVIDGSKFLGRIVLKDSRTFHIIKGDKIIVIRRKRVLEPK